MATTWTDLQAFVGADDSEEAFVTSCHDEADALVTGFIGTNTVPAVIKDRCVLNVGAELYHSKNAPNGIAQFSQTPEAPIRIARDPMVSAYPLLRQFMVVGL